MNGVVIMSKLGALRLLALLCWLLLDPVLSSEHASKEYFNAKSALVAQLTNNSSVNREILPVLGESSPVVLKISISLRQISNVNEINQAIRLTVWLRLFWHNPFLEWKPSEYLGIKNVHLDSDNIWTPDISLFNEASLGEEIDILYRRMNTRLVIHYTGEVKWYAPVALLTQCKIDVSRFPFDRQTCNITLGSWTYSAANINVTYKDQQVDLTEFITNGEWKIISAMLHRNSKYYETSDAHYPDITFVLKIKRRPLYYIINLLVPCSLIALLSFISFGLPSNHGERVSLVITVLLANSVYMLIVSSSLPQTSDAVPVIAIYFVAMIVEIALCLCATCLTSKLHEQAVEMPHWFDRLVNHWIARFICIKNARMYNKCDDDNEATEKLKNEKFSRIGERKEYNGHATNGIDHPQPQDQLEFVETSFVSNRHKDDSGTLTKGNHSGLILSEIRLLADEVRARNEKDLLSKKWRRAARILDRAFLMIFVIIYIILTAYLLASM